VRELAILLRASLATACLAGGCGRISFDPLDPSQCSFSIQPATPQVNLSSRVQLTAQGARGAVMWRVASGQGSIDESGLFFAGDRVETVTIEATDQDLCTGSTTVGVRGSTLFYAAGQDVNAIPMADVWSTANGVAWSRIGALPMARALGKLVVFDDRMWWIGGGSEVWSTTDGVTWRTEAPMPVGYVESGSAIYRERMWIVGGSNGVNKDTVYSSADGAMWQLTGHLPVALHGTKCSVFLERLWCVGGHASARFDRVFSSVDGIAWADEAPLPFIREEQGQIVLSGEQLLIIAGSDLVSDRADGAVTRDGVTWTPQGSLPQPRFITDLAQIDDTIFVVGAQSAVLATTDGITWTDVGAMPMYRDSGGLAVFTPH